MDLQHEDFKAKHPVGFCKIPSDRAKVPLLSVGGQRFVAPLEVDLRGYETRTENQGQLPYCAAYTAAGFTENIKWRVNGYPKDIDPVPLYKFAKTIDGDPNGDGTTLDAVCEALRHYGYFDADKCRTRLIWGDEGNARDNIRFALHRYGVALGAFNITEEWYDKNKVNHVVAIPNSPHIGGHAVEICGFNQQGVIVHNSWGVEWGLKGFAIVSWSEFDSQFIYAAVLTNALDGLK